MPDNPNKPIINNKTGRLKPPKQEATNVCNAREDEKYCQNLAGQGTDHEGTGRCAKHGGRSTGRPKKSFSAAEFLNDDIIKTFEETSDLDPSMLSNFDNEINVIRSSFYSYLRDSFSKKELPHPDYLKKYTDSLTKLVDMKHKLETKITAEKIPTRIIFCYVDKLKDILQRRISDENLLHLISEDMKRVKMDTNADGQGRK